MNMHRSTKLALSAFVLLLAAVMLTRERTVSVGVQKLTVPVIDPASVTALEISGANKALLTLDGNVWQVADPAGPAKKFQADDGQVKNALTQLSALRAGEFVTENVAKHAELEVDDVKGLKVKASSAAPALELVIGKAAKTGGGTYIRLVGSNAVFTANSAVGYSLRKNVAAWRKKSIGTTALADVQKISMNPIESDGFTLTRAESGSWSIEGDLPAFFRFDETAAARLAQTLTSLSAQDFSDAESDASSFNAPHTVATLTLKDGKQTAIHFGSGKKPDGSVPVRIDGDAQVYIVSGYVFEQLVKHRDQLRQTNLMAFDAAKVTRLAISSGGKKVVVVKDGAGWKMTEPKANADFDSAQVTSLLTRWSSMRATRVAAMTSQAEAGLLKAKPTLELTLEGGKTQRLVFGNELVDEAAGKQVYARGSADDLVYVVSAAERSSFEAGPAQFKTPPPMPANAGMQGLDSLPPDIRAKIEAQLRQQQPH